MSPPLKMSRKRVDFFSSPSPLKYFREKEKERRDSFFSSTRSVSHIRILKEDSDKKGGLYPLLSFSLSLSSVGIIISTLSRSAYGENRI